MKNLSSLEKVRGEWKEDYDAYLIYKPEFVERRDLFYFTGFPGSTGFFFQTKKQNYVVVDSRYHATARFHAKKGIQVVEVPHGESYYAAIANLIQNSKVRRLAVEDYAPIGFWRFLQAELPKYIRIEAVRGFAMTARRVKSAIEIKTLTEAQRITDAIFRKLPKLIIPGRHTEYEAGLLIADEARKLGAEGVSFAPIVAGNANAARPHHLSGNDRIPKRGALLFDFGVIYHGYCSDFTRTVWIGKNPDKKFVEAYDTVLKAHAEGVLACVFPKTKKAKDVDVAARKIIDSSVFKGTFIHGLGHGVGLEVHEGASVSSRSEDVLGQNEIVTVEPGIYLPGKFGIRIEDMVIAGSGEMLSRVPRKLVVW